MDFVVQYHRLLFTQILLGILAFCIAQQSPTLLLTAGTVAALAWYVTEGPHGKKLPRWAVNIGALGALAWPIMEMQWRVSYLGLAVGHFLLGLQIVMLYAPRSNRDDSAMIVLSLMLVVSGAVISDAMIYGLFLAVYSLVALPTLLLFHLKLTRDEVRAANQAAAPDPRRVPQPRIAVGRGHRLHFRTATLGIGLVCGTAAILVFVLFPRWQPGATATKLTGRFERYRTGYSDTMQLGPRAPLTGPANAVMRVRVTEGGKNIGASGISWLIRGSALGTYEPRNHLWRESDLSGDASSQINVSGEGKQLSRAPVGVSSINADFTLMQTQGSHLFSLEPVNDGMARFTHLRGKNITKISYSRLNQNLRTDNNGESITKYRVSTPSRVGRLVKGDAQAKTIRRYKHYARRWTTGRKAVHQLVSGILKRAGIKGKLTLDSSQTDWRAARYLAAYLRTHFRYTLNNPSMHGRLDPVIQFLFRWHAGHCELFAAGLAAMARVAGLPARVVTGYLASEYNPYGRYYVIRQRDAHAWTEIYCGNRYGWLPIDATPPVAMAAEYARVDHWYSTFREFYDYLAFRWMGTIAGYDQAARKALLKHFGGSVEHRTGNGSWVTSLIHWFKTLPHRWRLNVLDYSLVAVFLGLLFAGLAVILRITMIRRRRMATLQLTSLPRNQRRGLGRKLQFYMTMLDMLNRHGYQRPAWQSPFGFAKELAEADPGRFDPVVALTELFYEIRFGHRDLDQDRRQRVRSHLKHLEQVLS